MPKPGEPDTDSKIAQHAGPGCVWHNSEAGDTIGIGFILAVGISQTLAFRVGEYGRLKEKSCDRAVTVAAAVVRTLKGGA